MINYFETGNARYHAQYLEKGIDQAISEENPNYSKSTYYALLISALVGSDQKEKEEARTEIFRLGNIGFNILCKEMDATAALAYQKQSS